MKVTGIVEDDTPFQLVYDPEHPDADEEGYVKCQMLIHLEKWSI